MSAREAIIKDSAIPLQYNLLIINKSSETSIKIESHVDYMVINNSSWDTQTQVKGRVSNDLEVLYLPATDNIVIVVPERFLNKLLNKEKKAELCEALNIRKEGNAGYYKWGKIKERLQEKGSGYRVIEERIDSKRYDRIIPVKPAEENASCQD